MSEEPEQIYLRHLTENADHHYLSVDHKWMMWVWRNIVLLKSTGRWSAENTALYVSQCFSLFKRFRETWSKVYHLIDTNDMEIQTEEFCRYLKENWAHLLDREDLCISIVEEKTMKRLIWKSIYQLIGKQDRVLLFSDFTEAFAWVRGQRVNNGA